MIFLSNRLIKQSK